MRSVRVSADADALTRAAAEHFVSLAAGAIADHGRFAVALAGGSTPRAMYALLATPGFAERVRWASVHVFFGDERCVPPDHPDSNYRMAREALLSHVPIPADNVHRILCEMQPDRAAPNYERRLGAFFGGERAQFDLVLLGMGDDGHTASLFPGTAAIHKPKRWVVAHYVEKLGAWRVTLTPVAINAAANVTFLVSGSAKAERLRGVLEGPCQPDVLPAQVVRPTEGAVVWMVDEQAAARLQQSRAR